MAQAQVRVDEELKRFEEKVFRKKGSYRVFDLPSSCNGMKLEIIVNGKLYRYDLWMPDAECASQCNLEDDFVGCYSDCLDEFAKDGLDAEDMVVDGPYEVKKLDEKDVKYGDFTIRLVIPPWCL